MRTVHCAVVAVAQHQALATRTAAGLLPVGVVQQAFVSRVALGALCVCRYHRYTIKEAPDKFVLTTHSPGESQEVEEVPHAAFRPELKR